MGKISPVSSKYIIHSTIEIQGVVDRPDVIGAIFGQTEGLLGADLELRELQRSGRIGRIEVNVDVKSGKSQGEIIIPSSLDKAETAIIGAALEIIQRIGPCNAKIKVEKIEDVRISKREFVVERAKNLLKNMVDGVIPDSQELADEVSQSVRVMEITSYGKGKLPAGPMVEESEDIIIVEGRADVLTLLKNGFKNGIAIGGTGIPEEVVELTKRKETTLFVDGDRGGDLIIKELLGIAEIDFVTKAPDGKEVEELTKKEIHKALRGKIATEQAEHEFNLKAVEYSNNNNNTKNYQYKKSDNKYDKKQSYEKRSKDSSNQNQARKQMQKRGGFQNESSPSQSTRSKTVVTDELKSKFLSLSEDLIGTRAALILDDSMVVLGKVPVSELESTIKSLSSGIHAIVFDGIIDKNIVSISEKAKIRYLVGTDLKIKESDTNINVLITSNL